jgi:hypothetical protein
MPQMGQPPGSDCTTSGCIGQVYSVRVADGSASGSSAIPHLMQGPGVVSRTSGCIGHTYTSPVGLVLDAGVPLTIDNCGFVGPRSR